MNITEQNFLKTRIWLFIVVLSFTITIAKSLAFPTNWNLSRYYVSYENSPPSDDWQLVFRGVDRKFNLITETWFDRDSEIFVFENKKALPRIFMVSNVEWSASDGDKRFDTYFFDKVKKRG